MIVLVVVFVVMAAAVTEIVMFGVRHGRIQCMGEPGFLFGRLVFGIIVFPPALALEMKTRCRQQFAQARALAARAFDERIFPEPLQYIKAVPAGIASVVEYRQRLVFQLVRIACILDKFSAIASRSLDISDAWPATGGYCGAIGERSFIVRTSLYRVGYTLRLLGAKKAANRRGRIKAWPQRAGNLSIPDSRSAADS
jgi:hypothetical protein